MSSGRIVAALVILALVAVVVVNKFGGKQEGAVAKAGSGPMSLTGVVVQATSLNDRISSTGTLMANNSIVVSNQVAGRLVHLDFKEGQHVAKGALLAKIDDADLQAQLSKALSDETLAKSTLARQKDNLAANGIAQQDYDLAVGALADIKANIAALHAQIANTEMRAPFPGTVGLRNVSEGAYLPAFTNIADLQQLDPMKLDFTIPQRYNGRLSVGDSVQFTVESSAKVHTGAIYAFEPGVDAATGGLRARALCRNPGRSLVPGAFAKVQVNLKRIEGALMVPSQAVVPVLNGQQVLLCKQGKAVPVAVTMGLRNDSTVQLTSGIQAGDTVLTSGMMQLRPGMAVKVTVTNATAPHSAP